MWSSGHFHLEWRPGIYVGYDVEKESFTKISSIGALEMLVSTHMLYQRVEATHRHRTVDFFRHQGFAVAATMKRIHIGAFSNRILHFVTGQVDNLEYF